MNYGFPVTTLVAKNDYVENGVGTITYVGTFDAPEFHAPNTQGLP